MAQVCLEASLSEFQKGYIEGYKDALTDVSEGFYKTQNRPVDEQKSTAWMDVPEGGEKSAKQLLDEMGDLFSEFCKTWVKEERNA